MYSAKMKAADVRKTLAQHILTDGFDLVYDPAKSRGAYLYDALAQKYFLDFFSGYASIPLGYNHPGMTEDADFLNQLLEAALANPSNADVYTTHFAEFIQCFSQVGIPSYLPHAFFISGGGVAVENALKAAMDWKVQKNFKKGYQQEKGFKVLHFEQAFHGRTGYTLSLTNTDPIKTQGFAKFDWPRIAAPAIAFPLDHETLIQQEETCIAQIKKAFEQYPDEICAIIIEPIQCEGGDRHFRQSFFEALRQLANEQDCLLIYDEVQTGVGITGKFWCHEHFGDKARPDILVFGKKMQVCGILASERLDEVANNVFRVSSRINSTWGGNLTDMVRASQILKIIQKEQLVEQAAIHGAYLQSALQNLAEEFDCISAVRGTGLLCAFDLDSRGQRDECLKACFKKGLLILGCGNQSIRFRPALSIQNNEIDAGLQLLKQVLEEITCQTFA